MVLHVRYICIRSEMLWVITSVLRLLKNLMAVLLCHTIQGAIVLVISNQPCAAPLTDFEITRQITPWNVLHSVQLLLLIINKNYCRIFHSVNGLLYFRGFKISWQPLEFRLLLDFLSLDTLVIAISLEQPSLTCHSHLLTLPFADAYFKTFWNLWYFLRTILKF